MLGYQLSAISFSCHLTSDFRLTTQDFRHLARVAFNIFNIFITFHNVRSSRLPSPA
jgi:hypothetical protein